MKLLFYGATEVERAYIDNWSEENGVQVDAISENINQRNVELSKYYDGVCLYPSSEMRGSEAIYQKLYQNGISQISVKSTGVDGINFELASKYNLTITNVPSYSPTSVGHYTLMMILMLLRQIPLHHKGCKRRGGGLGRELSEVTIGIVGTGRIGSVVAKALSGMGANVIAYSESENQQLEKLVKYVSFKELIATSDVISIHIPLTEKSRYLFSVNEFEMMKNDVLVVNTARGEIIDTRALVEALKHKQIAGIAIDAIEGEEEYFNDNWRENPFCQQLMQYDNVIITPHVAYYTDLAVKEIVYTALDNAVTVIRGTYSQNIIAI